MKIRGGIKQMKKFILIMFSSILVLSGLLTGSMKNVPTVKAETEGSPIFSISDVQVTEEDPYSLDEYLDDLVALDEGTIIIEFSADELASVHSLISVSNGDVEADHFHIYITESSVGLENRVSEDGDIHVNKTELSIGTDKTHSIVLVVSEDEGYKYYLDGELVHHDEESAVRFISAINEPTHAELGRTKRAEGANEYAFTGTISNVEVYAEVLSDDQVTEKVGSGSSVGVEPLVRVTDSKIGESFFDLTDQVEELSQLDEGTIVARFIATDDLSGVHSLFSISNDEYPADYFSLYIRDGVIGSENRFNGPDEAGGNTHVVTDGLSLGLDQVHTLAMVVDADYGYKYYLDGELVLDEASDQVEFLSNIFEPNKSFVGQTARAEGENQYELQADIELLEVYDTPLSDDDLVQLTSPSGEATEEPVEEPVEEEPVEEEPVEEDPVVEEPAEEEPAVDEVEESSSNTWLIVLIIVLVIAGIGGYVVYSRNKDSNKN